MCVFSLTEISATAPLKMAAIKTTAIQMTAIAYLPIKTIVVTRDLPTTISPATDFFPILTVCFCSLSFGIERVESPPTM